MFQTKLLGHPRLPGSAAERLAPDDAAANRRQLRLGLWLVDVIAPEASQRERNKREIKVTGVISSAPVLYFNFQLSSKTSCRLSGSIEAGPAMGVGGNHHRRDRAKQLVVTDQALSSAAASSAAGCDIEFS